MAVVAALIAGYLFVFHYVAIVDAFVRVFGSMRSERPEACTAVGAPVYNTTSLKVVLPSVGQTGTTSVLQALRQLGFRSYHDEETRLFAPAALGETLQDLHAFVEPVSRCRVEALSLEPYIDLLPYAVQSSPDAKFVLTWRDFDSWIASTSRASGKDVRTSFVLDQLLRLFWLTELSWWYDRASGHISDVFARGDPFLGDGEASVAATVVSLARGRGVADPEFGTFWRGTYKTAGLEEAYLAHVDEIRRLVPPARLLEFDAARHGWSELAGFLGVRAPLSGTPFPHSRTHGARVNHLLLRRSSAAAALGICVLVGSLNFTLVIIAVRLFALLGICLLKCLAVVLRVMAD